MFFSNSRDFVLFQWFLPLFFLNINITETGEILEKEYKYKICGNRHSVRRLHELNSSADNIIFSNKALNKSNTDNKLGEGKKNNNKKRKKANQKTKAKKNRKSE